jgi:HEAT repeat protein
MRVRLLLLVLVTATCVDSRAQADPCATLKTKDTQALRELLEEQQTLRESPCLPSAIRQLGQLRDVEAIHLLVGYLDYLEPKTGPLPNGGATVRPSYPAVSALFQIGKPAAIELLSAIQAGGTPRARENAVRAYADVFRDDLSSGIRAIENSRATGKDRR